MARGGQGGTARVDLYASKSSIVGRLEPVVAALERRGVSPDAVTLAAVPVAFLGGLTLIAAQGNIYLLLAVPMFAGARLVLNLLDGALARRTGRTHARGELLNEVGDRIADVLFLVPSAFMPGAIPEYVLLGIIAALLASYVGITTRAAGGERIYRGVLSKPGRMVLLSVAALGAFGWGSVVWAWYGPVLLLGATLTLVDRLRIAFRQLH